MRVEIELINERRGMIAVRTEFDEYSVLELLGGYTPMIGDIISGDFSLGGETVKNITQGEKLGGFYPRQIGIETVGPENDKLIYFSPH